MIDTAAIRARSSVACSLKPLHSIASGLSSDGANAEMAVANDCSLGVYWAEEDPHCALSAEFILRKWVKFGWSHSSYAMQEPNKPGCVAYSPWSLANGSCRRNADASVNSSTRSMKASGSLLPVKLSSHLLTASMRRLVSAAVGKSWCAPPIGAATGLILLVLLTGAEILDKTNNNSQLSKR
uniref:Uncharacterized protein n=1 Tax=Glossina austeni TaxID=7395 RepID=A0A1A9V0N6_GLOAU